jgi:hypothetical protein
MNATERWEKEWFRKLPPHLKCLWEYILSKCDCTGVWSPDFELATFYIGQKVTVADLKHFNGHLVPWKGKWWVAEFCKFQYGKLRSTAPVHVKILHRLEEHGLIDLAVDVQEGGRESLAQALSNPSPSLQEEEEAQEEDRAEEEATEEEVKGRTWKQR